MLFHFISLQSMELDARLASMGISRVVFSHIVWEW